METSIPAYFKEIAALHPSRTALVGEEWSPTYGELDAVTDAFAYRLVARGGKNGDRVAILMRQDAPLLAATLSVLKAGRTVVVLNPADPPERLRQILSDAEPDMIITDLTNEKLARQIGAKDPVVWSEQCKQASELNLETVIRPADHAWLIYTSGSTGRPKGVIQTHRNIIHNVLRLSQGMKLSEQDRVILLGFPSSGQGVASSWCALLNGAALCPFPIAEKGIARLAEWMLPNRITVFVSSASVFRNFVKILDNGAFFPGMRLIRLGADPSTADDFDACRKFFRDRCMLMVTLSSTETGNVTQQLFTHDSKVAGRRLPVGRPVTGMEIMLLNERGEEVPNGEDGEIVVRSRFLSPGYWRNDALTAERFSEDADGVRIFRSGDLGRWTADGTLYFAGRKDARVKIHGNLVEISEVEDVLAQQAGVAMVAVIAQVLPDGGTRLAAYILLHEGQNCTAETLRQELWKVLPGYMTPGIFVFLEEMPFTQAGKIDRDKLRQLPPPTTADSGEAAVTPTEVLLAGIWQKVFNRKHIGRHDNFFDLGGDSLNATVIAAEIYAALNVELETRAFVEHDTLSRLAKAIDRSPREAKKSMSVLVRAPRNVPLPLSFKQEWIWKHSQTPQESLGYVTSGCYRITGVLDVEIFHASINYVVRRHEILRTTFDEINGQPMQIVQTVKPLSLPLLDLSGRPDPKAEAEREYKGEAGIGFDFRRGPLLRLKLLRLSENEHWLLRVSHHIISDNKSWHIFFHELALIYEAKLQGKTLPLPEFEPLQFADYAVRQRTLLQPKEIGFRQQLDWWREMFAKQAAPMKMPFRRLWKNDRAKSAEGKIWWGLDSAISQRLGEIARKENVTYYAIRLAAFSALWSVDNPEMIFGTSITDRTCVATQNLLGDFSNPVTLRFACDRLQTFRAWMLSVQKTVHDAQLHASIPYGLLCEEMRKQGVKQPSFNVLFNLTNPVAPQSFGGLTIAWFDRLDVAMPSGFSMVFDQQDEAHRCRLMFDARIYHPTRVRKWLERFKRLLRNVSENPDRPIGEILAASREKLFF